MNLLPNVAGHTLANWPLQPGDLTDHSGNGLNFTAITVTGHAPGAVTNWTSFGGGVSGLDLGGTFAQDTMLSAPVSPLLQMTGACTFEWLMAQHFTFTNTYFTCCSPPARDGGFGNGAPDIKGSLYTLYWAATGHPSIGDQFYGGGGGITTGQDCLDANADNWADVPTIVPYVFTPHLYAITRSAAGVWNFYRDGVAFATTVAKAGTNVAVGTEQFFVAGTEFINNGGAGWFCSIRIQDRALTPPEIQDDTNYVFGSAGPPAAGMVYDAVAASQFSLALRQQPRR